MNLMRMIFRHCILAIMLLLVFRVQAQRYQIIPKPQVQQWTEDSLLVNKDIYIQYKGKNDTIQKTITLYQEQLHKLTGLPVSTAKGGAGVITIRVQDNIKTPLHSEGYILDISTKDITIQAKGHAGVFYALQSLRQLLPPVRTNEKIVLRAGHIEDQPKINWRGMMLDVSRHFYTKESLFHILDLLAQYKMNVFHWHLCDNEGWRLEIKKYPKLTEVAAWRNEVVGSRMYSKDSTINLRDTYRYGGYYTQAEVREVVAYAAQRNITILPEIEMPGHSGAVLAAYPELSCNGKAQAVPNRTVVGGIVDQATVNMEFCAGKEQAFHFLEDVLEEVISLFPGKYIHIGGDEVDKAHWKSCSACQARKRDLGLQDEDELQSYFVKRMEKFLSSKGRKLIGWDEILEGGLPESSTVMSWRGEKGGIKAAQMGHDVIMSPSDPLYFNRYQDDPAAEPWAARFSINTLDKVYAYWPYRNLGGAEYDKFVKGVQFAIWTEFVPSVEHLEYMMLPRLPALAEAIWTGPAQKDYQDFVKRLNQGHFQRWQQSGVRFHSKLFRQ